MLSRRFRCIFVHIPKVAGQSIEHVFLDKHGLTWETRAPLLLRSNDDPAKGPPRLAHLKASEYVSCGYVTQEDYNTFFKFSFVRNPWSRLVSVYKYLGYQEVMPFTQFICKDLAGESGWEAPFFVKPQYDYLFNDNGEQLVDFIGRFETLQQDFDIVCQELGIPRTLLPHVNKGISGRKGITGARKFIKKLSPVHRIYDSHEDYTGYYDSHAIDYVAEKYAKEIEVFGYSFGA